jgi:hypothetical protein
LTKQALKEGALTISLDSYQLGGEPVVKLKSSFSQFGLKCIMIDSSRLLTLFHKSDTLHFQLENNSSGSQTHIKRLDIENGEKRG